MKTTTKTWLAKIAGKFIHRTSLLDRIIGFFYLKTKIEYRFNFHSSFGVLVSTFSMHIWMKEQQEQLELYLWRRKINQANVVRGNLLVWNIFIKGFMLRLSVSHILWGNTMSGGKILAYKSFMKLLTNQNVYNTDQDVFFKK